MFYKETEFQDSSIGKVPRDWDIRELGDEYIAEIIAGQSPPSSTYNKENHGLAFLQGKTEFGDMFPSPTVYCSKPIKLAEKDDVLLSVRAPVGDVNIAPFECCIGRGLAAIRTRKERLSHMFLFHYLRHEGRRFQALSTGSTFKAIRMREIESFQVPLPPTVEQTAIVGVLGVVDSAIELADKVIAKTERLKKGLMQQLLTRGIGHTEYKDTPIGKIPKEWDVRELSDETTADIIAGQSPSSSTYNKEYVGLPFLQGKMEFGEMFPSPTTYCSKPIKVAKKNDVLLSVRAPVGDVNIAPFECCIGRGLAAIRTKADKLDHLFLFYYLQHEGGRFDALSTGSTFKAIRIREIAKFSIPRPSLPEQQEIVEILSSVDKKIELERKEKEKLEKIKLSLMDLLLTGKVRIKVD